MPKLPDKQRDMINRLLKGSGDAEGLGIEGGKFTAAERLNVHKNNSRLILRDLLKDIYPATTILLGVEFMHFAAQEFISAFPPESGDMNSYGAGFGEFLGYIPDMRNYPFVPDTARLEWLAHEAYLSPREAALTAEDLATADPMALQLHIQPHVYLLRSGWPVDALWQKVSEQGAKLKDFELKPAETFIVICRDEEKVTVWSLPEGGYRFLETLQLNPSFPLAAEAALQVEPGLALDQLLARLVIKKIFMRQ